MRAVGFAFFLSLHYQSIRKLSFLLDAIVFSYRLLLIVVALQTATGNQMILAEGVSKIIDMLRSEDKSVSAAAMAVVANMTNDDGYALVSLFTRSGALRL